MHSNIQGKYEEYRRLNEEMAFHRESTAKNRNYCTTLFAALSGFAIKERQPELFVVAWLIVYWYWKNYNQANHFYTRISRYIAKFIEGNDTGIHWENRVVGDKVAITTARLCWAQCSSPHAIMSLACVLGLIHYSVSGDPLSPPKLYLLLIGVLTNCWVAIRVSNRPWYELRDQWERFWNQNPSAGFQTPASDSVTCDEGGVDSRAPEE